MSPAAVLERPADPAAADEQAPVDSSPDLRAFIEMLFAVVRPGESIEIRSKVEGKSGATKFFAETAAQALTQVEFLSRDDGMNAWFSPNPRRPRDETEVEDSRGKKISVARVAFLFGDFDVPQEIFDIEDLLDLQNQRSMWVENKIRELAELPLLPAAVVRSGGGVQALWRLDQTREMLPAGDAGWQANVDDIENVQAALVKKLGGDPQVKDLSRVLRVPYTWNPKEKYRDGPLRVAIESIHPDRRHTFQELRDWVTGSRNSRVEAGRRLSEEGFQQLAAIGVAAWNDFLRKDGPGRHGLAGALAAVLSQHGAALDVAMDVVREICTRAGDPAVVDRLRWVSDTYTNADAGKRLAGWSILKAGLTSKAFDEIQALLNRELPIERSSNIVPAGARFALSDLGNAERLVEDHGFNLRYFIEREVWLVWNGSYWAEDRGQIVEQWAKQTIRSIYSEAQRPGAASQEIARHALRSERAERIKAMVTLARSEPGIGLTVAETNKDPFLFNCDNGTLDLKRGEFGPAQREHYITLASPVAYDPQATAPIWEKAVAEIIPDDDLRAFMQRKSGSCLSGDVSEQTLGIPYGNGSNGKSTYFGTIQAVLGPYAMQATSELLLSSDRGRPQYELADLFQKRLVVTSETGEWRRLSEPIVKLLTGGEPIRARNPYERFFEFLPTHKIFLSTNHKPEIVGSDRGIWRRVNLIPFEESFEGRENKRLMTELLAELPGVLNWLLKGCIDWQRNGLGRSSKIEGAVKAFQAKMDTLGTFISEYLTQCEKLTVPKGVVHSKYQEWAGPRGDDLLTKPKLSEALVERGFEGGKSNGVHIWKGWGLRPDDGEGRSDVPNADSHNSPHQSPYEEELGKTTSSTSLRPCRLPPFDEMVETLDERPPSQEVS